MLDLNEETLQSTLYAQNVGYLAIIESSGVPRQIFKGAQFLIPKEVVFFFQFK